MNTKDTKELESIANAINELIDNDFCGVIVWDYASGQALFRAVDVAFEDEAIILTGEQAQGEAENAPAELTTSAQKAEHITNALAFDFYMNVNHASEE